MSITIRQLGDADVEAVDPLLRAAYRVTFSRSLELHRNLAIQPDGWLIAERDGVPVGIVGVTNYRRFAYVGLMAVDPQVHRQGIGRMLMEALLRRDYPTLWLDATPAGAPLYRSYGFVQDGQSALYEQIKPVQCVAHAQVRRMIPADLPTLTALDAPIFGADRSRVLIRLLGELPERAFVAQDKLGKLAGFIFAQSATLGPWVATTPTLAAALIDTALALAPIEHARVLIAQSHPHADAILAERGFVLQRTLEHMRRGPAQHWGQPELRYGLTSFALG